MQAKATARGNAVDAYLAAVPAASRTALETLRRRIRAAAPHASEGITYGIVAYKQEGLLVGFGAAQGHCSFFPMNPKTIEEFGGELEGFKTSRGTIRFTPQRPLPAALVRRIVKARLHENEARAAGPKT